MTTVPVRHAGTIIFPASLDPKAVTVVERLTEAGFETYLVGGCVRDLLLGHIPKDFDVSTEARPRQIRRVFRNCRVIGRRFKLAHVHFGPKIIEVATFRRSPEDDPVDGDDELDNDSDDLLILRDNVYGTAEQDAIRRDFTINALLYDVGKAEVIDWVGGVEDLEQRVLRTIGDAEVRIAEDPVRMLRAIKFTARLGLTLDPELDAAMRRSAAAIERSAPPRVLEEINKLLTCGKAEVGLAMLLDYGLLARLLPEVAPYWERHRDELVSLGHALDLIDRGQRRVGNALLLAMLWHDPWREQLQADDGGDPTALVRELITPAAMRMSIPRRDVGHMKTLLTTQLRLEKPRKGRRFRVSEFLARPAVQESIDFLYLRCLAGVADPEQHAEWAEKLAWQFGERLTIESRDEAESVEAPPAKRRRRRSRGGRRRGGQRGDDRLDDERDDDARADVRSDTSRAESRSRRESDDPSADSAPSPRAPRRQQTETEDRAPPPSERAPAPSHARMAAQDSATPRRDDAAQGESEPTSGLKRLVGRLLRRVRPKPGAGDAPGRHPAPADARALTGTHDPTGPTDSAGTADGRSEETDRSIEPPSPAEHGSPPSAQRSGDSEAASDGDPVKRRRRRGGRRRKRGGSASSDRGTGAAGEPAGDPPIARTSGEDPSGGEGSKRRRRRRGGSGGGKSGDRARGGTTEGQAGGRSGGKSGTSTRSDKAGKPGKSDKSSKSDKPGKSGGRSGARSDKPPRERQRDREFSPDAGPAEPGSPQRHPEDVEDFFDW